MLQNVKPAAGFDAAGGRASPELLIFMPGTSRCACGAGFQSSQFGGQKNFQRRHCPICGADARHISISKYNQPGRLRFNFRGPQPPPQSLNRSEFAGLKSAACGSRLRRAYRPYRRCGRVAEGGGLLNRYRVVKPYRGFESLRLRQLYATAYPAIRSSRAARRTGSCGHVVPGSPAGAFRSQASCRVRRQLPEDRGEGSPPCRSR